MKDEEEEWTQRQDNTDNATTKAEWDFFQKGLVTKAQVTLLELRMKMDFWVLIIGHLY